MYGIYALCIFVHKIFFRCTFCNIVVLCLYCVCIVFALYLYCISPSPPAANERTLHILPHSVAGESASNTYFPRLLLLLSDIFHHTFLFQFFFFGLYYLLSWMILVLSDICHHKFLSFDILHPLSQIVILDWIGFWICSQIGIHCSETTHWNPVSPK